MDDSLKVSEDEVDDGPLFSNSIQKPIDVEFVATEDEMLQQATTAEHEAIQEHLNEVRDIYSFVSYIGFTVMNIIFNSH